MKSEINKKVNKHDYSRRTLHKGSICKILFPSSLHREGMTEKQIHAKMKFVSDRTVYNLLKELILENRIFKSSKQKKYYLNLFFDDGWSVFARFLEEFLLRQHNLKELPLPKIRSNGYIFSHNLENEIRNFGNIVGAFVMYVLIESLRPNERMIRRETRDKIWESFLQKAVFMPYILDRFKDQLPESMDLYRIIFGSDNMSFDKLYNAYNNVYPGFSGFMDNSFKNYVAREPFESCDHEWRKVKVHKIGDRHECRKCLGLAKEEDFEPVSD